MKKRITINKNGEIPLEAFSDLFDTSNIGYYSMEVKNKVLSITFYDKKKKPIKLKGKDK